MILVGDAKIELDIHPKLPDNVTPERQDEIINAMSDMLYKGKIYSGTTEAQVEQVFVQGKSIVLRVRVPDGRIEIS